MKIQHNIKTLIIILLGVVVILGSVVAFFAGLDWINQKSEERQPKPYQETYTEGDLSITCNYSASGRLLIKNIYNTTTKTTTTYNYIYESVGWGTNLVEVQVITVDENGTIISQSKKE